LPTGHDEANPEFMDSEGVNYTIIIPRCGAVLVVHVPKNFINVLDGDIDKFPTKISHRA
jgi:hypothetical protein